MMTAAAAVIATLWLLTILLAAILPAHKTGHGLRRIDGFVLLLTVAFGITWFAGMLFTPSRTFVSTARKKTPRSCASVKLGESEANVRRFLGKPDEMRSEEDVRGPGADVWIYRDNRCAVHTLGGNVIFIE